MENEKDKTQLPDEETRYNEAGVEGNDQNEAIRNEGETGNESTLGNAEKSERGKAEFNADQGVDDKPNCQTLSENGIDRSNRGEVEFSEENDI